MKKVAILGSSGSIGESTLEVVRTFPQRFKVTALAVNRNIQSLIKQIEEFHPEVVAVTNKKSADELRVLYKGKTKILFGEEGLNEIAASCEYDIFVGAMVGFAGLKPTIEAIKRGKRIALANKETLVVAGELITKLAQKTGAEIIPVDSEHSAIFQSLVGEEKSAIKKIILTASGGPFRNKTRTELKSVTVKDALNHPTWKMGSKITIDSATLMNKGLEVIEAHWLFNLPKEKIEVVVHPQSIIHSCVEFVDGSIKAQLSTPDMKLPIQYALTFPERLESNHVKTDFVKIREMNFYEPDINTFECLPLAYDVLEKGGTTPCILNASNEVAVQKFLNGQISFLQIAETIKKSLENISNVAHPDFEDIINCDNETRIYANSIF